MFPAVFAKNYSPAPLPELLAKVTAHGYRGVQFNLSCVGIASLPAYIPDAVCAGSARMARARGIVMAALSGTYNMIHPDISVRTSAHAGFANVIAAAKQMGAPVVTLCTGSRHPSNMWAEHPDNNTPAAWKDLRAELDFALEIATPAGITLAVEPEPGNVIANAHLARRLLDEVKNPYLGIILDAANLLSVNTLPQQHEIMREAVGLLAGNIVLAHAKDISTNGKVVAPLQGAVDLHHFVHLLQQTGFTGALVAHGFDPVDNALAAQGMGELCAGLEERPGYEA